MRVVYVAGAMRSGTTITGQVLAASPSTLLAGEIRPVVRDPARHQHCDCGNTRADCAFWSAVDAAAVTPPAGVDPDRAYSFSILPKLLVALVLKRPLPAEVRVTVTFLQALLSAAGDKQVIDTSKVPMGIVLWRLAGERVGVVHCLRSIREVAAAQARPSAQTGLKEVPVTKSYAVWMAYNLVTLLFLRPLVTVYKIVRYRQLRQQPRRTAVRIWKSIGAQSPDDAGGTRFDYADSHVLAGNPRRERGSSVTIEPIGSGRA